MAKGQLQQQEQPWTILQNRIELDTDMKLTRSGKIALSILVVIIVAAAIGVIVYFVVYGKTPFYYHVTFKLSNVDYDSKFGKPYSQEYIDLNERIVSLVNKTFQASKLRRQYVISHVAKVRQASGKAIVDLVLKFKSCYNNNAAVFRDRARNILLQKLTGDTGSVCIDSSSFKLTGCGRRTKASPGNKIAGGLDSVEGEWPWQASLQQNNIHRCGATLISNNWLLTAAHCFVNAKDPREWSVTFGLLLSDSKLRRSVKNIIVHEKYQYPAHHYDIAVINLSKPVLYTSNVRKVCLPEANYNFPPNSDVVVTGWGSRKTDGTSPDVLQKGIMRIIDTATCNKKEVYDGTITDGMLCAGFLAGRIDACQGDSGGPLVSSDSRGIWFLVGIVSWGDECALPNKPGVYTRVTYYRNWITSKTGL
ncbi:transmembrane protease serine 11C-like [Trichosurus vulpecula]|uniref:transmembrane protease serine 11C-like n=1 Tax=Trichosurus vulpecula TaxID=9337 RepID=UPI00186AED9A|nr:transmembrane protease serine 11C-like [Trichosurus vulpecula]